MSSPNGPSMPSARPAAPQPRRAPMNQHSHQEMALLTAATASSWVAHHRSRASHICSRSALIELMAGCGGWWSGQADLNHAVAFDPVEGFQYASPNDGVPALAG